MLLRRAAFSAFRVGLGVKAEEGEEEEVVEEEDMARVRGRRGRRERRWCWVEGEERKDGARRTAVEAGGLGQRRRKERVKKACCGGGVVSKKEVTRTGAALVMQGGWR